MDITRIDLELLCKNDTHAQDEKCIQYAHAVITVTSHWHYLNLYSNKWERKDICISWKWSKHTINPFPVNFTGIGFTPYVAESLKMKAVSFAEIKVTVVVGHGLQECFSIVHSERRAPKSPSGYWHTLS